jgi:HlyD family secretion protein
LVFILVGCGAAGIYHFAGRQRAAAFRTAPVERGEILSTISATGTLNAVVTVQVGTQVSGTVSQLLVDFNSPVTKGMLIARIDPASFETKVNQARADLESARASVLNQQAAEARAVADLASARANVTHEAVAVRDARVKLDSRARLFQEGGISQEERDSAQAAHDSAVAQLAAAQAGVSAAEAARKVAQAQVSAAGAQVRQKQAALDQAQVDLDHTFIRAPLDGIVVSRNVDVGQTVAASLQAPTLFVLAQDLTKMEVDISVDEADVSRVTLDQEVSFNVDSYPGQTFRGRVMQIRQAPQIVQNVVTYTVVAAVANPDLRLKPGMTANARILVARRGDAILVPNAAFRVRLDGLGAGREPKTAAGRQRADGITQQVTLLQDDKPVMRRVRTGLSDGQKTEVLEGLSGTETVIVGLASAAAGRAGRTPGSPGLRF